MIPDNLAEPQTNASALPQPLAKLDLLILNLGTTVVKSKDAARRVSESWI